MKPIIAVPAISALVYRAYSRKSLTPVGILTASATAIAHAVHPWSVFFALLAVFFLAGTTVTKVKHDIKSKVTQSASGSSGGEGPRTHIQVLANSLVASILILLHLLSIRNNGTYWEKDLCFHRGADVLVIGIVANYAAVAADTFSSELGILAKSKPRLITAPWRIVPPGTNGGVTLTGLGAGLLGAFILSATSTLLLPFCADWSLNTKAQYTVAMTLAGFTGTLLDSLLGALFQASVIDIHTGKVIEGAGGKKVLVHGISALRFKPTADLRSMAGTHGESKDDVAKTSALAGAAGARTMQRAGAEGTNVPGQAQESRRIEVGTDVLDNNAVNILMAGSVSFGAMAVAAWVWGVSLGEVVL